MSGDFNKSIKTAFYPIFSSSFRSIAGNEMKKIAKTINKLINENTQYNETQEKELSVHVDNKLKIHDF